MKRRQQAPAGMFGSEEELCSSFIEVARAAGYQVHPECGNWDLLIVCRETGDQIGLHAKLKPNVAVLAQALTNERLPGPVIHAVLVPVATAEFLFVAKRLRLLVLEGVRLDSLNLREVFAKAPRWAHPEREWAPEVEISARSGVPSPRKITKWKLAAVDLCLRARVRGYVTRAEMKELNLRMGWWLNPKYGAVLARRVVDGKRKRGEYVLRDPSSPLVPDYRFPEVVEALQKRGHLAAPAPSAPPPAPSSPPALTQPARPKMRVKKRTTTDAPAQQRSTIRPPSTTDAATGPIPRAPKVVRLIDDEDEEAASRK